MKNKKIKKGDEIDVVIIKKKNDALIEKILGIAKGSPGFDRDEIDRF
jgi:hypothetical protein